MKFYQGLLPAIIWDPRHGRPLVEFVKGVADVDDEDIIKRLHKEGYLVEEDVAVLEAGGNIAHGGFEPQIPVDKDLPSGRSPMDNPEMAPGGLPHKRERLTDSLPENEQVDLAKGGKVGLADKPEEGAKRTKKITRKTTSKKSTSKKKTTSKKSTPKKRMITRREE